MGVFLILKVNRGTIMIYYSNMEKYINKKFMVATFVGGIVILVTTMLVNLLLSFTGYTPHIPNVIFAFGFFPLKIVGGFLLAYFIAYTHECIPHCASTLYVKWSKYGTLVSFGIFALLALTAPNLPILYSIVYAALVGYASSLVIIHILYLYEPGKSVKKAGVCDTK